jgi:hypothetical protein
MVEITKEIYKKVSERMTKIYENRSKNDHISLDSLDPFLLAAAKFINGHIDMPFGSFSTAKIFSSSSNIFGFDNNQIDSIMLHVVTPNLVLNFHTIEHGLISSKSNIGELCRLTA